ncbi:hypothetical protein EV182_005281 [Spiromyces aspiralis]|uniref:Uncharacterized protein n=1 Tax=Spiromyces aspiralis TaxID=68401 RepID=A0ACC1HAT6_9FUNG|nr:hypothetical protein EV182_005281 [Spiromyces aspiralis]
MLAGFGRRFLRASSQVATSYASGGDGSANVSPTYPSADTLNSASPLSSPSPSPILANPAIIFFIVGGVTFDEIRQINQLAIEVAPSYTVLIGSNLIASAPQFLQQLIKSI